MNPLALTGLGIVGAIILALVAVPLVGGGTLTHSYPISFGSIRFGSDVGSANTYNDTITFVAGSGVTLELNETTNTLILNATGSLIGHLGDVANGCSDSQILKYQSSNSTWICSDQSSGSGDNLGNHTATQTLNMSGNTIDDVGILISNAVTPANDGIIRLGNAEFISWFNSAGTILSRIYFNSNIFVVQPNEAASSDFYSFSSTEADWTGNNLRNVGFYESSSSDPADSGTLRFGNAEIIGFEASPTGTDGQITFNTNEEFEIMPTTNEIYSFNATHIDVGLNKLAGSMGCVDTNILEYDSTTGEWQCGTDNTGSGGPTVLGSDVTCTATASYCTVFTIPLTPSSGNAIDVHLVTDTNTAGVAIQTRARGDDGQITGFCTHRTYTTASAEALDILTVVGTPADTGETAWIWGANVPAPQTIECSVQADSSSPQNLIIEIQMEGAATGTIRAGSYYIKTP